MKRSRDGLGYRCGKCGQLKAGHVCGVAPAAPAAHVVPAARAIDSGRPTAAASAGDSSMRTCPGAAAPPGTGAPAPGEPPPMPMAASTSAPVKAHVVQQDEAADPIVDAATAVSAILWPPSDETYLDLLRKYDLRPSELDALRPQARIGPEYQADIPDLLTLNATKIVHIVDTDAVRAVARRYANGVVFTKKHHEDALKCPPPDAALLLVVSAEEQPPYTNVRSILLYTRARRGVVHVVHTRDEWTKRGYAFRLAQAVQDKVPARGSLTIDSPGCTARAAVSLWLRARFMGDGELLKCDLYDDAAYMGARSVRLGFVWEKDTTAIDEDARIRFLQKVAQKHPKMATACELASISRV